MQKRNMSTKKRKRVEVKKKRPTSQWKWRVIGERLATTDP